AEDGDGDENDQDRVEHHACGRFGGEELGRQRSAEEGQFHEADEQQGGDEEEQGDRQVRVAVEEGGGEGQEGDEGEVDHVQAGVDGIDGAQVPNEMEVGDPVERQDGHGDEEGEQVAVSGEEGLGEVLGG